MMKTDDVSKLFLAIFERTYDGLYICCSMFLSKVRTWGAILHPLTWKRALKAQPKLGSVLYGGIYQGSPFTDIPVYSTV